MDPEVWVVEKRRGRDGLLQYFCIFDSEQDALRAADHLYNKRSKVYVWNMMVESSAKAAED